MIDLLQSFLLSLLTQLGRLLSFAAREVLRPQILIDMTTSPRISAR